MENGIKQNKNTDRLVILLLAASAVFLTFLTCPFSPIYRYNFEPDEICYQIMSLGWLKGKIPYRDLFDHKGPLTYVIYSLGLLLTGKNTLGILFVFSAINIGSFILVYKTMRLCFPENKSIVGTTLILSLFFAAKYPLFASGTKPDHFILLFLLISEYLYVRGIKEYRKKINALSSSETEKKESSKQKVSPVVFGKRDRFLIGLCCGAVFMIKMNVCIYFLTFIGFYFLWLLYKKEGKAFFWSCGLFLSGIVLVCLPFFIYYSLNGALSDLIYAYFTFNIKYAGKGGIHLFLSRPYIEMHNQYTIVLLFVVLAGASLCYYLSGKNDKTQRLVTLLCGAPVYAMIAFPETFAYTFVLLLPLYLWGTAIFSDLLVSFLPEKITRIAPVVMAVFIVGNFAIYQLLLLPSIPKEKPEYETAMETYYESHPDATCLYFTNLCHGFHYSYSSALPDFRFFFMPREGTSDMYAAQIDYVRKGIPDVIAFFRTPDVDEAFMEKMDTFFSEGGYHLYFDDFDDSQYYIYVRNE